MIKMSTASVFRGNLIAPLLSTDTILPLDDRDGDKLATLVGPDEYCYLVISSGDSQEVVKASVSCSSIVIERSTTPLNFPRYSEVCLRVLYQGVKDLICQTECCIDECCEAVAVAGTNVPDAIVNTPYTASVIFSGSLPINIAHSNVPLWLKDILVYNNHITLSGTPTEQGSFVLSVCATNCNGSLVTVPLTIEVK